MIDPESAHRRERCGRSGHREEMRQANSYYSLRSIPNRPWPERLTRREVFSSRELDSLSTSTPSPLSWCTATSSRLEVTTAALVVTARLTLMSSATTAALEVTTVRIRLALLHEQALASDAVRVSSNGCFVTIWSLEFGECGVLS